MRKEDNREKYKEYDHRYYIKHRRPNSKIGKLETKISDLEAKLAELKEQLAISELEALAKVKEKNMSKCWYCNNELTTGDNPKHFGICNKCYDEMFKSGDAIIRSLTDKIAELKQQLAEKEKEIAYLTKQVKKFNNEAQKYFEDAYCNDFHNQDKISFAVEVLKIAQDYVQQYVNNFDDMNDCLCAIDNQIKQLKEMK